MLPLSVPLPIDAERATREREPTIISSGCEDGVRETLVGVRRSDETEEAFSGRRASAGWRRRPRMIFGEPSGRERLRKPCGDLLYRESVSPCLKRILCGERSENQKPRRFLWRKPEKKNQHLYPIEVDHTPLPHRSKGRSDRKPGRLNPDFREARNFTLLRAVRVGKWGLSGLSVPISLARHPGGPDPAETRAQGGAGVHRPPP